MVVAGGAGSRMGGPAKQFRLLDGRPVVCWAARAMLEVTTGPIVVVFPEDQLEEGDDALRFHLPDAGDRLQVVAGGERRQDSVRAGLEGVERETVLVHDAVRPFASPDLVARVARRAFRGRAVVPGLPIVDTLKEIDGEHVVRTWDRARFMRVQTPQGFPTAVLREAHAGSGDREATDDASLCEAIGVPVSWVEGERINRKLTNPEDWLWAERAVADGRVRWS